MPRKKPLKPFQPISVSVAEQVFGAYGNIIPASHDPDMALMIECKWCGKPYDIYKGLGWLRRHFATKHPEHYAVIEADNKAKIEEYTKGESDQ